MQLAYRAGWTFTFDRKNRLKSHTHNETDDVTHLWWDGLGRVWQRWDYDSGGEMWSDYLTRFVYDGGVLAQEHLFDAIGDGSWEYEYDRLMHDYLRQPAGTRDRKASDGGYVDYFLLTDGGTVSGRFTRGASLSLDKAQREIAGDRQARYSVAGGPPTTGDFTDVSNLGYASTYIESFGGTKTGDSQFFDALNQFGDRHYLPGLGRALSRRRNPYSIDPGGDLGGTRFGGGWGSLPVPPGGREDGLRFVPVDPGRLSRGRIGQPEQLQAGGGVAGGVRDRPTWVDCSCWGCRNWIDDYCIHVYSSFSWQTICCGDPPSVEDIALCMLVLDPCQDQAAAYDCFELVCGVTDEERECICGVLEGLDPTDEALTYAWDECDYCQGGGVGPFPYDPCAQYERECEPLGQPLCEYRYPSPYAVCRANTFGGLDPIQALCSAAQTACMAGCTGKTGLELILCEYCCAAYYSKCCVLVAASYTECPQK